MKQCITSNQLGELDEGQKKVIRKWFNETYDCPAGLQPPLYIGQLIELLGKDWYEGMFYGNCTEPCKNRAEIYEIRDGLELCDRLWNKVKTKLSN